MSDQWDRACMAWHTVAGIDLPLCTTVGIRFTFRHRENGKTGNATLDTDGRARRRRHFGSASKTAHRRNHESYLADILGRRWNYIMPQETGLCVQSYVGQPRSDSLAVAKFPPWYRVWKHFPRWPDSNKTLFHKNPLGLSTAWNHNGLHWLPTIQQHLLPKPNILDLSRLSKLAFGRN